MAVRRGQSGPSPRGTPGTSSRPPREVAGFAEAAGGLLPYVPPTPPPLLPGTTAHRAINLWVGKTLAGVAVLLLTLKVVERLELPGVLHALAVFSLFGALFTVG